MTFLLALLPVVLFLVALVLMDSFKLVRPVDIGVAIAWGGLVALGLEAVHRVMLDSGQVDSRTLVRYIAPVGEELLKAVFIVVLFARHRVGFLVDAAVQGFAVGAGFALLENVSYLRAMPDAPLMLWVVRGLGTAVLHGATTAIVAILAKSWIDRARHSATPQIGTPEEAQSAAPSLPEADRAPHRVPVIVAVLPGLALAIAVHSAYNHLLLPPLASTTLPLIVLPLLVVAVFDRSERATGDWVAGGLDLDFDRLQSLVSQEFQTTNYGRYLQELKTRFDGPVVADMVCLLRLQLELSVQARALLMARQAGLTLPADTDLEPSLAEIAALRRSVGATGLLALKPLAVSTDSDAFHRYLLRG